MVGHSRLDLLKAQLLAMKMQQNPGPGMQQAMGYEGLQMQNQPVQSMLKPRYSSNMGSNKNLYQNSIRGYSGGIGY